MSNAETSGFTSAASPSGGETPSAKARRRTPAVAFLVGAAVIGVIAVGGYLMWGGRAETPVTPTEAVITDELPSMPVPDGKAITAQVDAALAQSPRDASQPAEQAAASAQAQTAPEGDDTPAAVRPASPAEAEAAIERDATRNVQAR